MKSLRIDPDMKEKWPQTRVGCLQYQVKVEKKNEDMWSYLKKDVFKKTRDAIFDYGVNDIPNIKESRLAYKAFEMCIRDSGCHQQSDLLAGQ